MSDLMLCGVLRMPMPHDPSNLGLIEWMQIKQRMAQAANELEERAARIEALERQVKAADALAEALTPFAVTLERYSGFTEYALFGIWEDVNGAAGRKLNILRMANFDDAKAALSAYCATKEGGA